MSAGKNSRSRVKPRAVMLSKRANVFYLEHVRVILKDDRIVYLTQDSGNIERYFNIPERNTAFLLLGKGSSITDAAMRRLAESNVVVGFCGSGGSPLFGALDIAFLAPQSEYRPTEYMQAWVKMWFDDSQRLDMGRQLLLARKRLAAQSWKDNPDLVKRGIVIPETLMENSIREIQSAQNTQNMLLAEARWAKALYGLLAQGFHVEFSRREGENKNTSFAETANRFLDHGNYIAYGYAAVALCGLGISFSFPILHGKTRRGALVFDIADLIKDAYVMPLAFTSAKRGDNQGDFRNALIECCQNEEALDLLFTFIQSVCKKGV